MKRFTPKEVERVLDEYSQAYFDANGQHVDIRENKGGWFYIHREDGMPTSSSPYRLKQLVMMTETLRRRIDEVKAEILLR